MEQEQINDYETFVEKYKQLIKNEDDCRWEKGDLALDVEVKYGQKSLQKFAEDVKEEYNTLRIYRKVSGIFRNDKRLSNMTWTHHFIAGFTDNPEEWLKKAKENNWSTRQLKRAIKKEKTPISETSRGITSLSLNQKIFEDFKQLCKEKHVVMSYLIEDIMKQLIIKWKAGEEIKAEIDFSKFNRA